MHYCDVSVSQPMPNMKTHPIIDPTVHVKPYMAKASVELDSSVISPSDALMTYSQESVFSLPPKFRHTATLPLRAPLMDRKTIIIQNFVDNPLRDVGKASGRTDKTDKSDPDIPTPKRPERMTGFLPILLVAKQH